MQGDGIRQNGKKETNDKMEHNSNLLTDKTFWRLRKEGSIHLD